MSVSVVIPVLNGEDVLARCLRALRESAVAPLEIVVVDDGSTDASRLVAASHGARVLSLPARGGPARARNLGAREAKGGVLFFLDADVVAHSDAVERVEAAFAAEPDLDAVIGSYDDAPADPGFLSQYKNLMHCFVHQTGQTQASTFWSGCGAIRREVFLAHGGFDETYTRPAIEDIELGYRLHRAGRRMKVDKRLLVKHLKRWTFWSLLKTDILDRGIPWTELILRDRNMPNDLNLQWSQRASVVLAFLAAGLAVWMPGVAAALLALLAALNRRFYLFLAAKRGWSFALAAIPMHFLYHLYSGASFAIGVLRFYSRWYAK